MIIVRTPLRISLGGGGTDLKSFYSLYGSTFVSVAINKYIYITLHRSGFSKKIRCRYSIMEEVEDVEDLKNEIMRETLKKYDVYDSIEVTSHAEIPSGTGLGSSGTFGVALAHALKVSNGMTLVREELAEEATEIQADILKHPIGKQDQYAAAFGGLNAYQVSKEGKVNVYPLDMLPESKALLESRLVMFFTGYSRDANNILGEQEKKTKQKDEIVIESLKEIQKYGFRIKDALEDGNLDMFGELMNLHWIEKKKRSNTMSNPEIDKWYKIGMENGALGGKLVGAGGGGFLLFYAHNVDRLVRAIDLKHVPFKFDYQGSTLL